MALLQKYLETISMINRLKKYFLWLSDIPSPLALIINYCFRMNTIFTHLNKHTELYTTHSLQDFTDIFMEMFYHFSKTVLPLGCLV